MNSVKKQIIVGHFAPLLTGCLLYIFFRHDTLKMFTWFDSVNLSGTLSEIRLATLPLSEHFPSWVLYSLPDGLWLFSFLTILLAFWNNTISNQNIFWLLCAPLLAIVSEFGQLFCLVPGTFDFVDVIFYLGGTFLPLVIYARLTGLKERNDK